MSEWTGTIVAKSDYGIKVEQDGEWWNWSKPEYRGEPFDAVEKGDSVRVEYADSETGKRYISVIERLGAAPQAPTEAPDARQRSIVRQTCIKAAAVSLQHGMGTPEEKAGGIIYLAGALEEWVTRE